MPWRVWKENRGVLHDKWVASEVFFECAYGVCMIRSWGEDDILFLHGCLGAEECEDV